MNLTTDKVSTNNGGGHSYKNPLRKYYLKKTFLLIRAYRQYYLGSWIIKLPFYKLTSNKDKIQKWRDRRKERHNDLQLAKKCFKTSKLFYPQIKAWVESSEFKEKYLDTNHPYPPLLNPTTIDYGTIDTDIAWEMNLPLPPKYDFIFFSNGSSASALGILFLEKSNVNHFIGYAPKDIYRTYYDILKTTTAKQQKTCLFFWSASANTRLPDFNENPKQFLYSISKKVPMLLIVRDPIGRLRHHLNHLGGSGYEIKPLMKRFNLTCTNYENLFYKPTYVNGKSYPDFTTFERKKSLNWAISQSFILDSVLQHLKDTISFIHCIEFNDLKPDKVIETLDNITNKLGLEQPKNTNIFLNRINRNCGGITQLPSILYAHPDDLTHNDKENLTTLNKNGGFSFIITTPQCIDDKQKNFVDITNEIQKDLIIDNSKIVIIIDKQELDNIKQNNQLYNASITYLKNYIKTLKEYTSSINSRLINESQILDYLREHKNARIAIKQMLDTELNYIKTYHPDFIQKWKYYLEFEKMCAELDGTDSNKGGA
ncbi:DUF2972 domain-containing protein [Helicobacter sp. 23-1048]